MCAANVCLVDGAVRRPGVSGVGHAAAPAPGQLLRRERVRAWTAYQAYQPYQTRHQPRRRRRRSSPAEQPLHRGRAPGGGWPAAPGASVQAPPGLQTHSRLARHAAHQERTRRARVRGGGGVWSCTPPRIAWWIPPTNSISTNSTSLYSRMYSRTLASAWPSGSAAAWWPQAPSTDKAVQRPFDPDAGTPTRPTFAPACSSMPWCSGYRAGPHVPPHRYKPRERRCVRSPVLARPSNREVIVLQCDGREGRTVR
jgi:hypothetical protein